MESISLITLFYFVWTKVISEISMIKAIFLNILLGNFRIQFNFLCNINLQHMQAQCTLQSHFHRIFQADWLKVFLGNPADSIDLLTFAEIG